MMIINYLQLSILVRILVYILYRIVAVFTYVFPFVICCILRIVERKSTTLLNHTDFTFWLTYICQLEQQHCTRKCLTNIINVINECIYHDIVLTITGDEYWLQKVTGQARSRILCTSGGTSAGILEQSVGARKLEYTVGAGLSYRAASQSPYL
jgi:hypothetical protein